MVAVFNKGLWSSCISNHVLDYPTPSNISYCWSFGSLCGFALVIQLVSGIVLSMQYSCDVDWAFVSVERIMRDVNYGWLLRYVHSNGASFFFIVLYLHMFRGVYYGSYKGTRRGLWLVGMVIYFLVMATGFLGYVLVWGQMSFWGATVITNMVTAVPYAGTVLVEFIWGGFSIGNPTLHRFFSLHYCLPFIISGVALVHLVILHINGSSNCLGVDSSSYRLSFYPYCYVKDLFAFLVFSFVFGLVVCFYPNVLGHGDNYEPADCIETPPHIVPEWYFLPFYAMLRSIPHKVLGVVVMFSSIVVYFVIPFIDNSSVRSGMVRPLFQYVFWCFVMVCLLLGWIGSEAIEYPFSELGLVLGSLYFGLLLIVFPVVSVIESYSSGEYE